MNDSLIPKVISVAVLPCLMLMTPMDSGVARIEVRTIPIFLVALAMIWFPEKASDYFSSQTSERTISRWGLVGLLLLALPAGIALISLR